MDLIILVAMLLMFLIQVDGLFIYIILIVNSPLLLENVALRMGNFQVMKASRMLTHVS